MEYSKIRPGLSVNAMPRLTQMDPTAVVCMTLASMKTNPMSFAKLLPPMQNSVKMLESPSIHGEPTSSAAQLVQRTATMKSVHQDALQLVSLSPLHWDATLYVLKDVSVTMALSLAEETAFPFPSVVAGTTINTTRREKYFTPVASATRSAYAQRAELYSAMLSLVGPTKSAK